MKCFQNLLGGQILSCSTSLDLFLLKIPTYPRNSSQIHKSFPQPLKRLFFSFIFFSPTVFKCKSIWVLHARSVEYSRVMFRSQENLRTRRLRVCLEDCPSSRIRPESVDDGSLKSTESVTCRKPLIVDKVSCFLNHGMFFWGLRLDVTILSQGLTLHTQVLDLRCWFLICLSLNGSCVAWLGRWSETVKADSWPKDDLKASRERNPRRKILDYGRMTMRPGRQT